MGKREHTLETGRYLSFRRGIRGVSMDDVAPRGRCQKKAVYAHFPGKEELVRALVEQLR